MKNSYNKQYYRVFFTIIFIMILSIPLEAQIKKPIVRNTSVAVHNLNIGIVTPNCNNLSTTSLYKMKIPQVKVETVKKSAPASTSWQITPMRPKSTKLSLASWYYGEYSLEAWSLLSRPRIEGQDFTGWFSSWLFLQFQQVGGNEYRMKIKLSGNRNFFRGKYLYVSAAGYIGRYPIDHVNGEVNVVWKAKASGNTPSLQIGQIEVPNSNPNNPAPKTRIKKITIAQI